MMSRILFLLSILLISFRSDAQNPEIYSRVKIMTGADGLGKLAAAGVAVDHGDFKEGESFTSDFSPWELEQVKASGLPYEVQIEDVSSYYVARNKQQAEQKPFGVEGCDACDVYATPANFQLGTMGGFYKYQEMLNVLDSMRSKYPTLITVKQPLSGTVTTIEGRPVYYVKISQQADQPSTRPQVLYSAVHHAREAESLSQLVFYMWYLLEHYATDDYVKYLVDHTEMYFVPCLNPDGYIYNETTNPNGGGMWRKNRRNNGDGSFGVDINRNYGQFWGYDNQGSSDNGQTEVYRGTAGFSEPETQMMRDFCNSHSFTLALNAHTFSNLLVYPWGHIPSLETPDSLAFRHFGKDMTSCSGFVAGTGNETVGYVVNGDSDDWMYGEQASKPKIIAFTPEAGNQSDGFWPQQNRIIPIAKQTMDQNLDLAKLATPFAEVYSMDAPFLESTAGFVHLNFKRSGMENSNFTISLIPVSSNISFGAPRSFNSPDHLRDYTDSISYMVATPISGNRIRFAIKWENAQGFSHSDTVTRYIGFTDTAFYNDGSTMAGLSSNSGWGVSTSTYKTAGGSITDSPNGDYSPNNTTEMTTSATIDLRNALAAYLSFYTKWDVEKGFDDVIISAAEENGNFNILCGKFNHRGNENQGNRKAIYDGKQPEWVREYIDLKDYLGMNIKIRFILTPDQGVQGDGFYVDDMTVVKLTKNLGVKDLSPDAEMSLQNVPNPCKSHTQILYKLPQNGHQYYLSITDATGRTIGWERLDPRKESFGLDLSSYSGGMYFYQVVSEQGTRSAIKKMVVLP